jgi:protein adenylyltransferase
LNITFKGAKNHSLLGEAFFHPVAPAQFPKQILRFRNDVQASRIGLGHLTDKQWCEHFASFKPLPGSLEEPLALAYHGHQFRSYNPELGDGRGFLFAQLVDPADSRLLDLGTKGSGQTPWSRTADGRLTLKGAVREILATEYLEALGVNTSKTFSVIETGEDLIRGDEPSPTRSAVMVRLSHSHIRIGSFQRLAALEMKDETERLLRYAVTNYYPDLNADLPLGNLILSFIEKVVEQTAATVADWMAAGFVHGVLNTDNINMTGESFDYGPWRFIPEADPNFTAAYFDQTSLYAYGRQPETFFWNLCRLAECFTMFLSTTDLETVVRPFEAVYRRALTAAMARRLGISAFDAERLDLGTNLLPALTKAKVPFEGFFFDHYGGRASRPSAPIQSPALTTLSSALKECAPAPGAMPKDDYFARSGPLTMLIEDVEALWANIDADDNWQPLYDKIEDIRSLAPLYKKTKG